MYATRFGVLKIPAYRMKLGQMLKEVIQSVLPSDQPALKAQLSFFIYQGYLEIAKSQSGQVTNLIQIMEKMSVKFLGTIKNNGCFPFQFVDIMIK